MGTPTSTSARWAVGIQSAKDTVATAFLGGRMRTSRANEEYNTVEPSPEHFAGDSDRATADKSAPYHTVSWQDIQFESYAYPDIIGCYLLMAGFKITGTVNNTASHAGYKHTFVLADRDELKWGSVIHHLGEGAEKVMRKVVDARLNRLAGTVSKRNGCGFNGTGMGLSVGPATGLETIVAETAAKFLPSSGSLSILTSAVEQFSCPSDWDWTIENNLRQEPDCLFEEVISDLPQASVRVSGNFQNVPFSKSVLEKLAYDGDFDTNSPALTVRQAAMVVTLLSGQYVDPLGTQPYQFKMSCPTAMLRLGQYQSSGDELVRVPISWRMLDLSSGVDPIEIELINNVPDYVDFV